MSSGNKYHRTIHGLRGGEATVDVYSVLLAFGVTDPGRQHAIKKLLCAGIRGKGGEGQDLREARDALDRAIQEAERTTPREAQSGNTPPWWAGVRAYVPVERAETSLGYEQVPAEGGAGTLGVSRDLLIGSAPSGFEASEGRPLCRDITIPAHLADKLAISAAAPTNVGARRCERRTRP